MKLLRLAFPIAAPIMATYAVLGFGYGMFAASSGLSLVYPMVMAALIYSGSVEFLMVTALAGDFQPVDIFVMSFLVGARHLFYGVSMLERYRGAGWRKFPLIFFMSDETFAITWGRPEPVGVNRHAFLLAVAVLDWLAWQAGVTCGAGLGHAIGLNMPELDFFMVASFTAIYTEQWLNEKNHFASVLGIVIGIPMVWLFGPSRFMLPSMGIVPAVLFAVRPLLEGKEASS